LAKRKPKSTSDIDIAGIESELKSYWSDRDAAIEK